MTSLSRLRKKMSENNVDAQIVNDLTNVHWLTGFTGSSGSALVTQKEAIFITDGRYSLQAVNEVLDMDVAIYQRPQSIEGCISEYARKFGISKVWFERSISYGTWQSWQTTFAGIELSAAPDLVRALRMIKTSDEIEKIKAACAITDACLEHVSRMIQVGVCEYDIQLDIEFFIKRQGADIAFTPIAVSGANSARPHGHATEKKLEHGDFVTLDLGAKKNGYCSDITRTFVVSDASSRHQHIYNEVLKAESSAINAATVGISGIDLDNVARKVFDENDFTQFFVHGLGHGLGRDVHDPGNLSQSSQDTLEAGQVWTIEPGLYIEGFGGVRIEDDVHVTPNGPVVLTKFPKELTVIG